MSSTQPIPGSYKKPPFSSSPYGVTPPPIPNIPPRTTGSPANNNPRGSIGDGGGGSYIAAATSFRPKSFNPRAASAGTGSYFSAHSQGSLADADNGNGGGLGEKKQIKGGNAGQAASSIGVGASALSKALEREGVAKAAQDDGASDNKLKADSLAPPDRTPSPAAIPRIPTPTNNEGQSETTVPEPSAPAATATPTDISEIPEEEKLRILRKHLVSAEERQQSTPTPGDGVSPGGSRTASIHAGQSTFSMPGPQGGAGGSGVSRASGARTPEAGASGIARSIRDDSGEPEADGEAFPIPYDAPGGDVT